MSWKCLVEAQWGTGFPTSCDAQGKGLLMCMVESPFIHRGLFMADLAMVDLFPKVPWNLLLRIRR